MRIADSYNPNALLQQQANLSAEASAQAKAGANKIAQKNETEAAGADDRQTYDLTLLANMSDEEYAAFGRATQGMDETQQERAAQTLQLIASAYEQSQRLINGGLLAALNGESQPSLLGDLSQGNLRGAINEGADILRRMTQEDQTQTVRLMERLTMALTQTGLNLRG